MMDKPVAARRLIMWNMQITPTRPLCALHRMRRRARPRPHRPAARTPAREPAMMEAPPLASQAPMMMEAPFPDEPAIYAAPRSSAGGKLWIILGGLAAAILIGVGIWWFTRDSDSNSTAAKAGGGGGPSTAILNFKVISADRQGSLNFTFDADPGTSRVQNMFASLGDNLAEINDAVDPDFETGARSFSSASGTRYCTISKDAARPNGWRGSVHFGRFNDPLPAGPQRVAFVYSNSDQMISAPLIVAVDFTRGTSEPAPLPAGAPRARKSKASIAMASMNRGLQSGGIRYSDPATMPAVAAQEAADIEPFDIPEGPGSRGILAGDFSPISAPAARSRGIEGRWRIVAIEGKPVPGTMTFDGSVITFSVEGRTHISTYRADPLSSKLKIRSTDGGRDADLVYELQGSRLRIHDASGSRAKDEVILERD